MRQVFREICRHVSPCSEKCTAGILDDRLGDKLGRILTKCLNTVQRAHGGIDGAAPGAVGGDQKRP